MSYSHATQPHTGSGGQVHQKAWDIPAKDAANLLRAVDEDGLLESEDVGGAVFPHYYVAASYGRWQMPLHLKSQPEKLFQRVLPLLQEAHPEQWGKPAR